MRQAHPVEQPEPPPAWFDQLGLGLLVLFAFLLLVAIGFEVGLLV